MSSLTLYNLIRTSGLAHSSRKMPGVQYSMPVALAKEFGTVYYNEKVILYDEAHNIIEIRMMMGSSGNSGNYENYAVRMALYGVKGKVYNSIEELIEDKMGLLEEDTEEDLQKMSKNVSKTMRNNNMKKGLFNKDEDKRSGNAETLDIARKGQLNDRLRGFVIPVANQNTTSFGKSFGTDGRFFYSDEHIDMNTPVRVSCSCPSYYYVFGWYNYGQGAHLGPRPTPYNKYIGKRITKKTVTVQNVGRQPGMCKHLMLFTALLLNGGILKSPDLENIMKGEIFDAARENIQHLKVPKRIATKKEMENMLRALDRDLKKTEKARNLASDFEKDYLEGFDAYKHTVARQNYKSGKAIRKGTSRAAYLNNAMSAGLNKRKDNPMLEAIRNKRYHMSITENKQYWDILEASMKAAVTGDKPKDPEFKPTKKQSKDLSGNLILEEAKRKYQQAYNTLKQKYGNDETVEWSRVEDQLRQVMRNTYASNPEVLREMYNW